MSAFAWRWPLERAKPKPMAGLWQQVNKRVKWPSWLRIWAVMLSCTLGCQPQSPPRIPDLPAPIESTTLGPGDILRLEVVGEKDFPEEYQVAPDGTINFPYIDNMKVSGLEAQDVAREVREQLIERRILKQPSVIVRVTEFRSKRITVLGQVKNPGSFSYQPGMTLVQAISQAGGVTALGRVEQVRLTRILKDRRSVTVIIDLDSINSGRLEDVPLQAGDRIFVEERVF
jgi:protein involved in polysaccharide export with SLBB domain